MAYDPENHHRRSIRLRGYDYIRPGAYFITICTHDRGCLFGEVTGGVMRCNARGRIVRNTWRRLPRHFSRVTVDAFVVMPNHIHGIIIITDRPERGHRRGDASAGSAPWVPVLDPEINGTVASNLTDAPPLRDVPPSPPNGTAPGSLGAIVQNFKSVTTRRINRRRGTPGLPVWQRNYWDRIVRDERALERIRRYIALNPSRWRGNA